MSSAPRLEVLPAPVWQAAEAAHADRADALTARWREWHGRGQPHPVEDFLFSYYPYRPAQLRRWHPGAGVVLADSAAGPRRSWAGYRPAPGPGAGESGADHAAAEGLVVDAAAFLQRHGPAVGAIERILRGALGRPAHLGCFGLHEWAMLYRAPAEERRHGSLPLRLGAAGTDRVVEGHRIACSHFDAFRFFTAEAAPRNALQPSRETQAAIEQPGCLHAGMDLYKWAVKLGPLVPGALLLDCFALAQQIRWLDMRASPYDTTPLGAAPVPIETAEGKAVYLEAQRGFAGRAQALRRRLLGALKAARADSARGAQTVLTSGASGSALHSFSEPS